MIEKLVAALNLELGLTGDEIADVLWLALHMQLSQLDQVSDAALAQSQSNDSNESRRSSDKTDNETLQNSSDKSGLAYLVCLNVIKYSSFSSIK